EGGSNIRAGSGAKRSIWRHQRSGTYDRVLDQLVGGARLVEGRRRERIDREMEAHLRKRALVSPPGQRASELQMAVASQLARNGVAGEDRQPCLRMRIEHSGEGRCEHRKVGTV